MPSLQFRDWVPGGVVEPAVLSSGEGDSPLAAGGLSPAVDGNRQSAHGESWESTIDQKLIEWGRNPALLQDEAVIPPTREALATAFKLARRLEKDRPQAPPSRTMPDGDGGVVFEWRRGCRLDALEISDQGAVEFLTFIDDRLVERGEIVL